MQPMDENTFLLTNRRKTCDLIDFGITNVITQNFKQNHVLNQKPINCLLIYIKHSNNYLPRQPTICILNWQNFRYLLQEVINIQIKTAEGIIKLPQMKQYTLTTNKQREWKATNTYTP